MTDKPATDQNGLRSIPGVDTILAQCTSIDSGCSIAILKAEITSTTDHIRASIRSGQIARSPDASSIAREVSKKIQAVMASGLAPVINATGVVIYTNLGRSPLSEKAVMAATMAASGYSDLEFDLETGTRGSRQDHIRSLTRYTFGAEDALVVNNNAAAVLLVLSSISKDREAIISRGELVEIGGSFRIPDVMAMSGAQMTEVGTTNRTDLRDYERAIQENTGLIVKVHRSNFSLTGFTQEVDIPVLASLAHSRGLPLYVDMGSGMPFDMDQYGIKDEWTIQYCLESGADIVSFSGDKVLGGPQAGIILGKKDLVNAMAQNPLHRAVRVDKFTIAALSATLRSIARGQYMDIPVLRMICESADKVEKRAYRLLEMIDSTQTKVVPTKAVTGGGTAPGKTFASFGVCLKMAMAARAHCGLRTGSPGIVARIDKEEIIFDMRCVFEREIETLALRINEVIRDGKKA
ncbi:MAG: L-seryl-tRNA(Sec) selenium transferase [Thermodesulfobacteriota bacterium]|nr:L-seryl-tRNA(Sec) selenium transferase [Thermodesulfobacteriota bacterium]